MNWGPLVAPKTCISNLLLPCHTQQQVPARSDKDWPDPTVDPGLELACVMVENGALPSQFWEAAILGRNTDLVDYF